MSSTLHPLIVAVDDDMEDLVLLRDTLQKTGRAHSFQPFANGEAAVTALASLLAQAETPNLPLVCFLDIKMTAMSGFEVLRWIRSQKSLESIPVLMLSSSDDPRDLDTARELGAQGFLKKHPSIEAMITVIEEATLFATGGSGAKPVFLHWSYRFVETLDAVPVK